MTEQTLSIETIAPRTPLQEFWFYFKQNKGAVIGLTFILAVALISIFAPWIAPFDPIEQNRSALLLPPAWYEGGNSAYLLGTDDIGRDILSRIIYGTR
ncbi:MAG: dipeptide ABC transporter permease DppC, partial [Haemophilus parainfluenzae]|nr:dipeptide ABC transporter permease DppC [Haemophilus parainfluenzae]